MYRALFVLAVVAMMTCSATAGEVSQSALADMGLSNMQSMSDEDGMAVRGKWALVGGIGTAAVLGGGSETTFFLAGTDRFNRNGAAGANLSFEGTVLGGALFTPWGDLGFVGGQLSLAFGAAAAGAW